MDELDVLEAIAESLSERKSLAALSNYQVLNNNVSYVNALFRESLFWLFEISNQMKVALKDDSSASSEAKDSTCSLYYFRKILPRLVVNGIQISEKFQSHTVPDDRRNITIENVHLLHKSFADYNELVTSTRQFVDSLISDSYQMVCLEPKVLNFQVLSSLSSFEKYATKSIWHSIMNDKLIKALKVFDSLDFGKRANSQFSKCKHITSAQKVDFVFSQLGISNSNFNDETKNIFKFSSEFTHVGYVSTMFSSTYDLECIFGDEISPYLPSTENFSELKYRLLETGVKLYSKIYLPSLKYALNKIMSSHSADINNKIDTLIDAINKGLNTRNNQYYFFIRSCLVGSDKNIELRCKCGETRIWTPPHDKSELFCRKCGSSFNLIEMKGDPGYIITSKGPVRVIGSDVPDLEDLPEEELKKLFEKCKEISKRVGNS
jgi:hypothetical protein